MSDSGQYRGSQAFSQKSGADESVNRSTGSLSYTQSILSIPGIVSSISLGISISYSQGIKGTFGLPANWSFGQSYITPAKTLTCQGTTYVIDNQWSDTTGYQSGLKYINNKGLKLSQFNDSQKLPCGKPGSYKWTFRLADGTVEYFDAVGKLRERRDVFGNFIYYEYSDDNAGPMDPKIRIKCITDSWAQSIDFIYPQGQHKIVISFSGADKPTICTITFNPSNGVQEIEDAEGYITSFTYMNRNSLSIVSTISYPTGLTSYFSYQDIEYLVSKSASGKLSAVRNHCQKQGKVLLNSTDYFFGSGLDNPGTFTGKIGGYIYGGLQDCLAESYDFHYRYDVLIRRKDGNGLNLSQSKLTYNYLSLLMKEEHHAVDKDEHWKKAYQTEYTYKLPTDRNKHTLEPSYIQPIVVENLCYNSSTQKYDPLRRATAEYDHYGCFINSEEAIWDNVKLEYVSQHVTNKKWIQAQWGGQMLKQEVFIDSVLGEQRIIKYTLNEEQTQLKSTAIEYQASSDATPQPWKTKSFSYDPQGRILTETVAWSAGVEFPAGTVSSYTHEFSHTFKDGIYEMTICDPQGNKQVSRYSKRINYGPLVEEILPLGQKTTYKYDGIGRRTERIDANGNKIKREYSIAETSSGVNTVKTTNSMRQPHIILRTHDALGRLIEEKDNGDPTSAFTTEPSRLLLRKAYNSLGLVAATTDRLNLTTSVDTYDSFNRVTQKTDPYGNIVSVKYDDEKKIVEKYINSELKSQSHLDNFGREVRTAVYPDSDDKNIDYKLVTEKSYDGHGRLLQIDEYKVAKDDSNSILIATKCAKYDAESKVYFQSLAVARDIEQPDQVDKLERTFTKDIFGNNHKAFKLVAYHDGQTFTHDGAESIFDNCGRLAVHRNQLSQEEKYGYDRNGRLQTLTEFDGSIINYTYDDLGQVIKIESDGAEDIEYEYLENGEISTSRNGSAGALEFQYSVDSSLTSVTYPDGRTQTYTLDKESRVVKEVDVSGLAHVNTFATKYQWLASRSCGNDKTTYNYGKVNHKWGQLVSQTISGNQSFRRDYSYNGFGQSTRDTLTDLESSKIIIDSKRTLNLLGKLQKTEVTSQKYPGIRELNYTSSMVYDGLGQLVQETRTDTTTGKEKSTSYALDGNSNVLAITRDGLVTQMTYNAIDQRADDGFVYDTNGRLQCDDKGRKYEYIKGDDRLKSVHITSSNNQSQFSYHPDGALASCSDQNGKTSLYYDDGDINAMQLDGTSDDGWVSFGTEPGRRTAAYRDSCQLKYFIDSDGSTCLVVKGDEKKPIQYQAYGTSQTSSALDFPESFGYRQEFTDQATGLVYLRARFYQPDNLAFITMDTLQKENRYSYCAGDPINMIDPSGQSEIPAFIAGAVVSAAVAIGSAGLVAAALAGSGGVVAVLACAGVSGAAGHLAGDLTSHAMARKAIAPERAAVDVLSGAIGGIVGAGSAMVVEEGGMLLGKVAQHAADSLRKITKHSGSLLRYGGEVTGAAFGATAESNIDNAILGGSEHRTAAESVTGFVGTALSIALFHTVFRNIGPRFIKTKRQYIQEADYDTVNAQFHLAKAQLDIAEADLNIQNITKVVKSVALPKIKEAEERLQMIRQKLEAQQKNATKANKKPKSSAKKFFSKALKIMSMMQPRN